MTRARRRHAHRTRLGMLSPWQRWCIVHGDREAHTAFATVEAWDETFASVKDALLEDIDDPATRFRGFWRYEPDVPDALSRADDLLDLLAYIELADGVLHRRRATKPLTSRRAQSHRPATRLAILR
jgi:hypothetical protein